MQVKSSTIHLFSTFLLLKLPFPGPEFHLRKTSHNKFKSGQFCSFSTLKERTVSIAASGQIYHLWIDRLKKSTLKINKAKLYLHSHLWTAAGRLTWKLEWETSYSDSYTEYKDSPELRVFIFTWFIPSFPPSISFPRQWLNLFSYWSHWKSEIYLIQAKQFHSSYCSHID